MKKTSLLLLKGEKLFPSLNQEKKIVSFLSSLRGTCFSFFEKKEKIEKWETSSSFLEKRKYTFPFLNENFVKLPL